MTATKAAQARRLQPKLARVLVVMPSPMFAEGVASMLGGSAGVDVVGVATTPRRVRDVVRRLGPGDTVVLVHVEAGGPGGGIAVADDLLSRRPDGSVTVMFVVPEAIDADGDSPAWLASLVDRIVLQGRSDSVVTDQLGRDELVDAVRRAAAGEQVLYGQQLVEQAAEVTFVPTNLSLRQRQVAVLLVDGLTYVEVSDRLGLARNTVKNHAQELYSKVQVSGRDQLRAQLGHVVDRWRADLPA